LKLLIISYSFAPDLTPRAFRWNKIVEHLAAKGHQIDVLCSGTPNIPYEIQQGTAVRVFRVKDWLLNASSRVTPGAGFASLKSDRASTFDFTGILRKFVRAIWRSIYWPDYSMGWVIPAMLVARKLSYSGNYDWVISVSHPFSGHVVGRAAVSNSPTSKWFVDVSDPYTDMPDPSPNNFLLYSHLNKSFENGVIEGANVISVTTKATMRLYQKNFPKSLGKIHVIPPLLSLPQMIEKDPSRDKGVFKFVYVGTLYKSLRSPKFLLKCFESMCKFLPEKCMELHFYGAVNDCHEDFENLGQSNVFVHGLVSREDVVIAMAGADVLVNIGNSAEAQLASKVIEYMSMGKPILNLVSIQCDASISVLANYASKLTIFCHEHKVSPFVVEKLKEFICKPPNIDPSALEQIRAMYSSDYVAGMYSSLLER